MYRNATTHWLSWFLALLFTTSTAYGAAPNDAPNSATGVEEEIRQAARVWLSNYAQLHQWDGAKVDAAVTATRLPAPTCGALYDIAPVNTDQPSHLIFSVRCPGDDNVTYYQARATIITKTIVATAPIAAGKPIDMRAVAVSERDLASTPDAVIDPAMLAFQVSRRTLKPGQVLQSRYLESEKLVHRDQPVMIVAHLGALEISTTGFATQDGTKDTLIRVRSGSANKIIAVRVTGRGTVEPIIAQ